MSVKTIWVTPDADKLIAYIARVSNPENQSNPNIAKLIRYCADNGHWSIFEQASMCVEIETSRAISAQLIRHNSCKFQEFSQRYSALGTFDFVIYEARRQDTKNRQSSIDDLDENTKEWFIAEQRRIWNTCYQSYQSAIRVGIAKECARMLLPISAKTRLYMTGSIRSWIHYIAARTHESTQKEHRDIAEMIKKEFMQAVPVTAQAMGWSSEV